MWQMLFSPKKKRKKGERIKMKKYYCNCQFNKMQRCVDEEGHCSYCKQEVKT